MNYTEEPKVHNSPLIRKMYNKLIIVMLALATLFVIVSFYTCLPSFINACRGDSLRRRDIKYDTNIGKYEHLVEHIRKTDLSRLKEEIYLDYTGSGLYRDSQVDSITKQMKSTLFGNPHSDSPSSLKADAIVEGMRDRILKWFDADPEKYTVIFTSGATGALHMIGESFPWSRDSHYYYLQENHNSVLGIRQFAGDHGASFHVVKEQEMLNIPKNPYTKENRLFPLKEGEDEIFNLFAYPLEENFSGKIFPLEYIQRVQGYDSFEKKGRWLVLLDAAAYVPTHHLNLTQYNPDFVTISFYKIFGFPTGTGCLIVKKDAITYLNKVYWGGGSVIQTISGDKGSIRLPGRLPRKYEDGTSNFMSIIQLEEGFKAIESVGGYTTITPYMNYLTKELYQGLSSLRHRNNNPVLQIYGNHGNTVELYGNYYSREDLNKTIYDTIQGSIVTCNVLAEDGTIIDFMEVERMAAKHHLHVRSGWHCNPGATFKSLNMKEEEVIRQIESHSCTSSYQCPHQEAITVINGTLAGGIRLSLGYLSTIEDVNAVIHFFKQYYSH
ncbi:hypothetical protein WA158_000848 [Blastocystis sp. Blastoise]